MIIEDKDLNIKHIIFDFDGVLYLEDARSNVWPKKTLNSEVMEWIRNNEGRFTFSILSNSGSSLEKLLREKLDIRDSFEHVFNSADIGLLKPDPAIFRYVLGELGAQSDECLFVDNLETNVGSARSVGMRVILFSSTAETLAILQDL